VTGAERDVRPSAVLPGRLSSWLSVAAGVLLTLLIRGYRFGESNHAVYLVDALRQLDPTLLRNDWWANSTLQYHFAFNVMTAALMRAGVLEPAFLLGYLLLAVLLHVAWRKLVLRLGGSDATYLVSVVLFYVLAGGVGLGMYHFLQDSSFLPSNVSNVAMLWGIYLWIAGMPALAGICFGLAGLFHINHALSGIGIWFCATAFEGRRVVGRSWWVGTFILLAMCAAQIVPALRAVLSRSGGLPTEQFIDLFVRFRHPHHFDPSTWHWAIWLTFLVPIPWAVIAAQKPAPPEHADARRRAGVMFKLYAAMVVLALVTAGFWFLAETFVQLNLFRFSIYPKLLTCIAVASLLWQGDTRRRVTVAGGLAMVAVVAASVAVSTGLLAPPTVRSPLGVKVAGLDGDDAAYLELARWARDHTPLDAIFLVPPDEESFRVHARRAIVVNFKGVPQLSAELPEWRDRLQTVLDLDTPGLLALPRPMGRTLRAIRERYDALPAAHHVDVARLYGARFIVLTRRSDVPGARLVSPDSTAPYFLYDLSSDGASPGLRPDRTDTVRLRPSRE
jgi:hypothetical protein